MPLCPAWTQPVLVRCNALEMGDAGMLVVGFLIPLRLFRCFAELVRGPMLTHVGAFVASGGMLRHCEEHFIRE
eukprot:8389573-Alexandrium_andersonii.AAC.1